MVSKPNLTEVTSIDEYKAIQERGRTWRFLMELRKRKVCRTAISYMLVMWLNLQIGDVIFPMTGLPDWSLSLIVVIGVMGFPVVLILAWAFQVTPEGIVLDGQSQGETRTDGRLDAIVNLLLLFLAIVLSVMLLVHFFTDDEWPFSAESATGAPTVVISDLSFESAIKEEVSQAIAFGIYGEIKHRLINLEGVEVLSDSASVVSPIEGRRVALSGSLFLEGKTAHVLVNMVDLSVGRYLMSITFDFQVASTLAAEAMAADMIVAEVNRLLVGDEANLAGAQEFDRVVEDGARLVAPHDRFDPHHE